MSFPQEVWKTLSSVNVNDKVEKKNGLSYLSWAWAATTPSQGHGHGKR